MTLHVLESRNFIFAGSDSTATALAQVVELLASYSDVQNKLRREVCENVEGRDLSYNELNALPLLDAVCRETLRL